MIALLILVTVMVDLLVWRSVLSSMPGPGRPPRFLLLPSWSLVLAQVSLAVLWAATSGKWMPWTTIALFATIACWSPIVGNPPGLVTGLLLLQAGTLAAAVGVGRALGLRLVLGGGISLPGAFPAPPRLQFSLGYLLSWVTTVASALGLLSYTLGRGTQISWYLEEWKSMTAIALGDTAIALVALWTMLGVGRLRSRISAQFLVAPAVLALWEFVGGIADLGELVVVCLLEILWLLLSLAVVRVAGYRLVRRGAGGRT